MIQYAMCKQFLQMYLERTLLATPAEIKLAHDMFSGHPAIDILSFSEDGTHATIKIMGPLSMDGPDFIDRLFGFGGTSYKEIIAASQLLRANNNVTDVTLMMSTPGGILDGLGETHQELLLLARSKNMVTENHGQLASAGYLLAVVSPTIRAMSPLTLTGSIGVVTGGVDTSEMDKHNGIKRITIVSKHAPNKRSDLTTAKGLAVVQDGVDAVERIFLDIVATGRNTTMEDVIENFGGGAMFVSRDPDKNKPDAMSVGMIDEVIDNNDGDGVIINQPALTSGLLEGNTMDLIKLKTDHPAIYAAAVAEGVQQGVKLENERVTTHLALGNSSGAISLALKNIADNVQHNGTSTALYAAAQMNAAAANERDGENVGDLNLNADGLSNGEESKELGIALAAKFGVKI